MAAQFGRRRNLDGGAIWTAGPIWKAGRGPGDPPYDAGVHLGAWHVDWSSRDFPLVGRVSSCGCLVECSGKGEGPGP
jgi:hypothetical protein